MRKPEQVYAKGSVGRNQRRRRGVTEEGRGQRRRGLTKDVAAEACKDGARGQCVIEFERICK